MTTLALPLRWQTPLPLRRSATHKLALAFVWMAVASGAVVFSEPAPVDVLTMGLIVLLPLIGLVVISRALLGLLAMMLVAAASAFLAAHLRRRHRTGHDPHGGLALPLPRHLRLRGLRGQAPRERMCS